MSKKEYSQEFYHIIELAKEEAIRLSCLLVEPQHIVLAIYRYSENNYCSAAEILKEINFPIKEHKIDIEKFFSKQMLELTYNDISKLEMSQTTKKMLDMAWLESKNSGGIIFAVHLLLAYHKLADNDLVYNKIKKRNPNFPYFKNETDLFNNTKTIDEKPQQLPKIQEEQQPFPGMLKKILDDLLGENTDDFLNKFTDNFKLNEKPKGTNITDKNFWKFKEELEKFLYNFNKYNNYEEIEEGDFNEEDFFEMFKGEENSFDGSPIDDGNLPFDWQNENKNAEISILEEIGSDLTQLAKEGKIDAVYGRDKEIDRLIYILERRKKNNPILIGESGVGKTAIVEGLALRIIKQPQNTFLAQKKIINVKMSSMVSGTMYRGQFEGRMLRLIDEIKADPNIIVFIDEIHTMMHAGDGENGLNAANILKPALARGEFQCIGTTSLDEYKKTIEKDPALERRFQKIIVQEPNEKETIEILNSVKKHYETFHKVKYSDKAIEACVKLSSRYITDRSFPDKAIDILDEAGATAKTKSKQNLPKNVLKTIDEINTLEAQKIEYANNQQYELAIELSEKIKKLKNNKNNLENIDAILINELDITEIVSRISGIPSSKLATSEIEKLSKIKDVLSKTVIGQELAIDKLSNSIIRNRTGISNPQKPVGSFIFLGSTGIGKTQLAKSLAKFLFDSEDSMIRIDMSEYTEKFSISRLIGAPPGYVGYQEGGMLTDKVRRNPYSIVLLDEIEKAHPDIYNILLQILDEGVLTDSFGRKVNFKNTIIIMTSNIGTQQITHFGNGVGFKTAASIENYDKNIQKIIENSLNKTFAPEFLNRIDEIIVFQSLNLENILKIVDILLAEIYTRMKELSYIIKISEKGKQLLANKGFDPKFGARPLKRAIQKNIEDKISENIISGKLKPNDTIIFDVNKENEFITKIKQAVIRSV